METTNGSAKVLDCDVLGCEDEENSVLVVDGEWGGLHGVGDHLLHAQTCELGTMGVPEIGVFAGDEDGAGDVGAGLISVEGKCVPPVRD